MEHQYIVRETGEIVNERLLADRAVELLYSRVREQAPGKVLASMKTAGLAQILQQLKDSGWTPSSAA